MKKNNTMRMIFAIIVAAMMTGCLLVVVSAIRDWMTPTVYEVELSEYCNGGSQYEYQINEDRELILTNLYANHYGLGYKEKITDDAVAFARQYGYCYRGREKKATTYLNANGDICIFADCYVLPLSEAPNVFIEDDYMVWQFTLEDQVVSKLSGEELERYANGDSAKVIARSHLESLRLLW